MQNEAQTKSVNKVAPWNAVAHDRRRVVDASHTVRRTWCVRVLNRLRCTTQATRICAAEMAVRYAALAEKYMCVIVIH